MSRGKMGGRQKGTPNKVTTMTKSVISGLLTSYHESGLMESDFMKLKPNERINIAEKMMEYVLPKCQRVEVDVINEQTLTIEARLMQLASEDKD